MVSITSKKTYADIQAKGLTERLQIKIYDVVARSNVHLTRREIAHHTGLENGSVAGRVNKMIENGVLEEGPKRKCRISKRLCGTVKLKGE